MFVFGIQYLRGATPEREHWKRDLANIKKLGFNTVRAWLVWNALERNDLEYIRKNPCSVSEVKVSVIQTEEGEDLVILINSAPQPKSGVVRLDRAYRSAKTVYGAPEAEIQKDTLAFSLESDESAVIRLYR